MPTPAPLVVLETVADLRSYASVATQVGSVICVESYATLGDACPARLYQVFVKATGAKPADDGGIYITSTTTSVAPWYYFVLQKPSSTIDARWYGVLGGGSNDTAAIQSVLNSVMTDGEANQNAEIEFPLGSELDQTVWYGGYPQYSLVMKSPSGGGRGTVQPTWRWVGSADTSMLVLMGAVETILDGMMFDSNSSGGTGGVQNLVHVASTRADTTLTASVTAGTAVVATVASMTDIVVDTALAVGKGTANWEIVYVTAVTATTFTATFRNNHASGEHVGGPVVGSEGVKFEKCGFQVGSIAANGASVCAILWGNPNNTQTPDVSVSSTTDCNFAFQGTPGDAYAGQRYIGSGNVKDFTNARNVYVGFQRSVAVENVGGHFTLSDEEFLNSTDADIYVRGLNIVTITGCGSEGAGGRFIDAASAGSNPMAVTVTGCTFEGPAPADDFVVMAFCSLTLVGNQFENFRAGAAGALIQGGNLDQLTSLNPGQITSIGNYYQQAVPTPVTPPITVFYDSSLNPVTPDANCVSQSLRVTSQGDYCDLGSLPQLTGQLMVLGAALSVPFGGAVAGRTIDAIGRVSDTYARVTLDHTAYQAAVMSKAVTIFDVPVGTQVVQVIAQVTQAFAGPTGPLTMRLGHSLGGQEYLKDFSAAGVADFGLAAGDLGTDLASAGAVQGGSLALWSGGGVIRAQLNSGSGNLSGLTAGSVRIFVVTRRSLLTT
jgi:hypothetical protein